MHYFTIEEILFLHYKIVEEFGGLHGVRDEGRLQAAAASPQQAVFGAEIHESLQNKAAAYLRNIVSDHPFVDGNKRTAVTLAVMFLQRNGQTLTATPKQLEDFAVKVAVDHLDVPAIASWLQQNCQPTDS